MKKLRLYLFMDALGWSLAEEFHFCRDFLPVRYPVKTQFGYSAGAVPTILSGKTPAEHGQFSFFFYNEKNSPFRWLRFVPRCFLPDGIWNRGRVRHWLSKLFQICYRYNGYFELYAVPFERLKLLDYSEKRDLFVPGGLSPFRNLADVYSENNVPYHISNWRNKSDVNFAEMAERIAAGQMEYGFLYCGSLDGFLHFHIGNKQEIHAEFQKYEEKIRALYEKALEKYDELEFTVISDHGMTPLAGTVDLNRTLRSLPYRWGKEYVSFLDATMARFWFPDPAAKTPVMQQTVANGHGRFLTEEERRQYGIAFPENRYGEEIFLLADGWQFEPSDMGKNALPGMHGYRPEHEGSTASFLSNVQPEKKPEWIGDFFQLMTRGLK